MSNGEPRDFNHLTAEERFFVAQNRLASTSGLMVEVIRLNEQKQALWASEAIRNMIGETHNEPVGPPDTLILTVINYEIVQVCRLWDKFDAHGFGLPTIAALLNADDVLPLIQRRLEAQSLLRNSNGAGFGILGQLGSLTEESSTQEQRQGPDVKELMESAEQAIKDVARVAELPAMQRLRNYRDKNIAHPIYRTRAEISKRLQGKEKGIGDVATADLNSVIDRTVSIMTTLERAILPNPHDYEVRRSEVRDEARGFYSRISYTPRS
ncbi:hypothetical protein HPT29_024115 [Microvirga terrae]|uniref:HEPN AbiU2-like domain-containing protein n=1 Tax=Microvirga terrae TaxID=2740529 RepID=A0ABY5RRD6_9HYPH|nr:hypothetical protein [Microvirga terrae]UVF19469.1 hypothetical protein HPT29_024115 [Microvirga terrae]